MATKHSRAEELIKKQQNLNNPHRFSHIHSLNAYFWEVTPRKQLSGGGKKKQHLETHNPKGAKCLPLTLWYDQVGYRMSTGANTADK